MWDDGTVSETSRNVLREMKKEQDSKE
jgi:hypothetical protein